MTRDTMFLQRHFQKQNKVSSLLAGDRTKNSVFYPSVMTDFIYWKLETKIRLKQSE